MRTNNRKHKRKLYTRLLRAPVKWFHFTGLYPLSVEDVNLNKSNELTATVEFDHGWLSAFREHELRK